jgi:hypothetical protein
MANLMGGYSGGSGSYVSPVRCGGVAESKIVHTEIKEEENIKSTTIALKSVVSVNFLEEFGYREDEEGEIQKPEGDLKTGRKRAAVNVKTSSHGKSKRGKNK